MVDRKISISLYAKNLLNRGLAQAGDALKAFGSSVASMSKWVVAELLAIGTSIVDITRRGAEAWAEQELAEKKMIAVLNSYGEAGGKILPLMKRIAAQIRDETGVTDQYVLAGMARIRMLGIETSKMEEAAKAMIGVKTIGLDGARAQKVVAMAMQGSYAMIQRYVPALRLMTTEQEKAAYVSKIFNMGYEAQRDLVTSVVERLAQFHTRVRDVMEVIGGIVAENDSLADAILRVNDAVKTVGESMKKWLEDSGVMDAVSGAISSAMNIIDSASGPRNASFSAMADLVAAAFKYAAEVAINVLKDGASEVGNMIGRAIKVTFGMRDAPAPGFMLMALRQLKAEGKYTDADAPRLFKPQDPNSRGAKMIVERARQLEARELEKISKERDESSKSAMDSLVAAKDAFTKSMVEVGKSADIENEKKRTSRSEWDLQRYYRGDSEGRGILYDMGKRPTGGDEARDWQRSLDEKRRDREAENLVRQEQAAARVAAHEKDRVANAEKALAEALQLEADVTLDMARIKHDAAAAEADAAENNAEELRRQAEESFKLATDKDYAKSKKKEQREADRAARRQKTLLEEGARIDAAIRRGLVRHKSARVMAAQIAQADEKAAIEASMSAEQKRNREKEEKKALEEAQKARDQVFKDIKDNTGKTAENTEYLEEDGIPAEG